MSLLFWDPLEWRVQFELWKLLFFEKKKEKKTPITKGGASSNVVLASSGRVCFFPHFFASCLKPVICVTFSRDFKYGQIELHGCLLLTPTLSYSQFSSYKNYSSVLCFVMFCLLTYTLLHEQWAIFVIRKKTFQKNEMMPLWN